MSREIYNELYKFVSELYDKDVTFRQICDESGTFIKQKETPDITKGNIPVDDMLKEYILDQNIPEDHIRIVDRYSALKGETPFIIQGHNSNAEMISEYLEFKEGMSEIVSKNKYVSRFGSWNINYTINEGNIDSVFDMYYLNDPNGPRLMTMGLNDELL